MIANGADQRRPSWADALAASPLRLYAGDLFVGSPQYSTHFGLTPFRGSPRSILHDVRRPMPIPDGTVDVYQSEDVFEHLPYELMPAVLNEVHRVLRVGGLFRLSIPDYRFDVYFNRCVRDGSGRLLFDPGGGGFYANGQVQGGGHLWFPVIERVMRMFEVSRFASQGRIEYLHYTAPDGTSVLRDIDYKLGHISRTPDHDERAAGNRRAMSIVVDAYRQ